MQDVFITKIHIGKVRHLENVDIALSETERKHLILTGKNGSGKTSLLDTLFDAVQYKQGLLEVQKKPEKVVQYPPPNIPVKSFGQIGISFSDEIKFSNDVLFAYRKIERGKLTIPDSGAPNKS
jgi:ABC-type branched-subunit amino acid transport system ATPase component